MSTNLQAECVLHITDETLSALRDDLLPAAEALRIRAHAATCAACHDSLDGFERVAAIMRGQRDTQPPTRLWDDVQAAITSAQRPSSPNPIAWLPPTHSSRPAWRGLGALAAALLIALLFGLLLHSALVGSGVSSVKPTATPANAETPIARTPPTWQQYHVPSGVAVPIAFTIAPSDGDVAYICDPINASGSANGAAGQARIAATHDRGAHWTWLSQISVGSGCGIILIDQLNANDLLVGGTLRSVDGGLTWSPERTSTTAGDIETFASFGGNVYAIVHVYDPQIDGTRTHLVLSSDGMASWHDIDQGVANGEAVRFWINGTSGALFAETSSSYWQSDDGGAHWSFILVPDYEPDNYMVQSSGTHTWRICSLAACTVDGGATWTTLPALALPKGLGAVWPLALTPNGSLLAVTNGAIVPEDEQPGPTLPESALYELPVGSAHWIALGLTPSPAEVLGPISAVQYKPSPGGGVLWEFVNGVDGNFSYYSATLPPGN